MDNRNSMVVYQSFYSTTKELPPEEFKEAWTALFEYAFNGEKADIQSPVAKMFFGMAAPLIDKSAQAKEWGSAGGRPKKGGLKTQKGGFSDEKGGFKSENPTIYDVDVDVDKDKDIDVDIDRQTTDKESEAEAETASGSQSVSTPTYQDVIKECRDQGYKANIASKFFMFYDKSQWKTKEGEPVKDWKKMLQIWNDNEHEEHPPNKKKKNGFDFEDQRHYNNDELEAALLDLGGGEDG